MKYNSEIWNLENFDFFAELSEKERRLVGSNMQMKFCKKGDPVYFQDDIANGVYFLKEGKVSLSRFDSDGNELIMGFLEAGEIFGESSAVSDKIRKESAFAEENVIYGVMKEDKMRELLLMTPGLNLKFSEILERRRQEEQKRLTDLFFKTNGQRIVDFIKGLAEKSVQAENEELILKNDFTHEQIARLTSTNRQDVCDVFCRLRKKGVMYYDRKSIRIMKLRELQAS